MLLSSKTIVSSTFHIVVSGSQNTFSWTLSGFTEENIFCVLQYHTFLLSGCHHIYEQTKGMNEVLGDYLVSVLTLSARSLYKVLFSMRSQATGFSQGIPFWGEIDLGLGLVRGPEFPGIACDSLCYPKFFIPGEAFPGSYGFFGCPNSDVWYPWLSRWGTWGLLFLGRWDTCVGSFQIRRWLLAILSFCGLFQGCSWFRRPFSSLTGYGLFWGSRPSFLGL